jgi:hypothetical protein
MWGIDPLYDRIFISVKLRAGESVGVQTLFQRHAGYNNIWCVGGHSPERMTSSVVVTEGDVLKLETLVLCGSVAVKTRKDVVTLTLEYGPGEKERLMVKKE